MKALSVKQPWAWLITNGYKPVENRTWKTNHRGNTLIHASKSCTQEEYDRAVAFVAKFDKAVAARIPALDKLECGGIIGIVGITDCVRQYDSRYFTGPWGFVLSNSYPYPFRAMRGMQGFFNVNSDGLPEEIPGSTEGKRPAE